MDVVISLVTKRNVCIDVYIPNLSEDDNSHRWMDESVFAIHGKQREKKTARNKANIQ